MHAREGGNVALNKERSEVNQLVELFFENQNIFISLFIIYQVWMMLCC
jgi:hypothetical protein